MILHRLGLVNKNQRGFTVVELMMAITISGVVAGAATMTIFQVIEGSARTNNHMIAVREVQSAGYWVSHDTQMAENADTDNLTDPEDILQLTWRDWDGDGHEVVYSLESMPDSGLKRLQRSSFVSGTPEGLAIVAQYIDPDPANTSCDLSDGKVIFKVTATVGSGSRQGSETRVYEVLPRPSS